MYIFVSTEVQDLHTKAGYSLRTAKESTSTPVQVWFRNKCVRNADRVGRTFLHPGQLYSRFSSRCISRKCLLTFFGLSLTHDPQMVQINPSFDLTELAAINFFKASLPKEESLVYQHFIVAYQILYTVFFYFLRRIKRYKSLEFRDILTSWCLSKCLQMADLVVDTELQWGQQNSSPASWCFST